ncbi:MAG: sterol desaturase/sphingolipid hydroxylase (fatty acid hydroxylase superfamily) [Oceanospirillaceae bacterium]|jgi:sterol desaturase/sphingolipid hydroxylase (fatty acid hydroxylase superfamily)
MLETLLTRVDEEIFYAWENWLSDWLFVVSLGLLALELVVVAFRSQMSWRLIADSVSNFITLYAFLGLSYLLLFTFYVSSFYYVYYNFSITQLPLTGWTLAGCIILADLVYYWEHRFMHRTGIGWTTHTVHHSSPEFNISVAYRFGPLDGILPIFFHLPLVMLGFNPLIIFLSEAIVQLYQTMLHTQLVKKLPGSIEAVFNTPSHHRVHHGKNREYLDKNYAGILIIWDRMFGTFAKEEKAVKYGVYPELNSVNPITIFCHGFVGLAKQLIKAKGIKQRCLIFIKPPGWLEKQS